MSHNAASQTSRDPSPQELRRVILASIAGNALEWYDFFLYGFAAALVFGQLFFPAGTDPLIGTLGAFAGFAMGFLARPLGGIIFAHFGDRYGRKNTLVATLTLMGGATFLMGLLPTYAQIGIWAPILVVVLRVLQGIATGGEWGGAVLIVTETAPKDRQGYYSSFGQVGLSGGFLLAAAAFYLAQRLPQEQFMSWGWRVPFLVSILIFAIGVFIRSRVPESKEFENTARQGATQRLPLLEVIKRHPREILTAMGLRFAENGGSYIFVAFSLAYAKYVGAPGDTVMLALMFSFLIQLPVLVGIGALSDRIGVWPLYLAGALGMCLFAFPFFWLIDAASTVSIFMAFIGANTVCFSLMNAVQPKLFSSLFDTEVRYSGLALGHEVASVFSGGLSPLIATALLSIYGASWPIALYLIFLGGITVFTLIASRVSRHWREPALAT
ncbi:Fosfomycin resistance protein AbaF [Hyphomicrobiales bacterium]|nr:Fosfomycin resistance protein AbaF [Hyphomicrobiales bacterium]CAH1690440.1 Fosfomycin resistance protein AbaF [Hyphomicrobiales bacterium]